MERPLPRRSISDPNTLSPGRYEEMIAEVRRALHRFMPGRNGDPKAGLAYTLLTVLGNAEERLGLTTDSDGTYKWCLIGEQTMARNVVHAIYYALVDTYVIKPGHPEKEKGGNEGP
jgi:hypothetical protein